MPIEIIYRLLPYPKSRNGDSYNWRSKASWASYF